MYTEAVTRWNQRESKNLPPYDYIDRMTRAYLEAAEWADLDEDITHSLDPSSLENWSAHSVTEAWLTCSDFARHNWDDLKGILASQAGHDLWLTSRGHGTGFWDRGMGEIGDRLTEACQDRNHSVVFLHKDSQKLGID